jgi:hypothetical protein
MSHPVQVQPLRKSFLDYIANFFLFFWDLFALICSSIAIWVCVTCKSYKDTFKDDPDSAMNQTIIWSAVILWIVIASVFFHSTWQILRMPH